MIRGTTPTHNFTLTFSADTLNKVKVIYAQEDKVLFIKEDDACARIGNTIQVKLTQEETLKFACEKYVQIQVRAITLGGDSLVSKVMLVTIDQCLESEVFE